MLARQIVVGFGIAVVFPLLIYYSVALFASPPLYLSPSTIAIDPNATPEQRQRAIQEDRHLREEASKIYLARMHRFTLLLFFIAVPLGLVAIVGGGWAQPNAIGIGFLLGGISTVGEGCYFHWAYLNDSLRFVSLLAALLALIYAGLRSITPPSGVSGKP
jgi:hypothetical protein